MLIHVHVQLYCCSVCCTVHALSIMLGVNPLGLSRSIFFSVASHVVTAFALRFPRRSAQAIKQALNGVRLEFRSLFSHCFSAFLRRESQICSKSCGSYRIDQHILARAYRTFHSKEFPFALVSQKCVCFAPVCLCLMRRARSFILITSCVYLLIVCNSELAVKLHSNTVNSWATPAAVERFR